MEDGLKIQVQIDPNEWYGIPVFHLNSKIGNTHLYTSCVIDPTRNPWEFLYIMTEVLIKEFKKQGAIA